MPTDPQSAGAAGTLSNQGAVAGRSPQVSPSEGTKSRGDEAMWNWLPLALSPLALLVFTPALYFVAWTSKVLPIIPALVMAVLLTEATAWVVARWAHARALRRGMAVSDIPTYWALIPFGWAYLAKARLRAPAIVGLLVTLAVVPLAVGEIAAVYRSVNKPPGMSSLEACIRSRLANGGGANFTGGELTTARGYAEYLCKGFSDGTTAPAFGVGPNTSR